MALAFKITNHIFVKLEFTLADFMIFVKNKGQEDSHSNVNFLKLIKELEN